MHAVGGVAGLYLNVQPSGSRNWILRVTVGNLRRDFGLGGFPDVKLADARDRARHARDQIQKGIDPSETKRTAKANAAAAQAKALTFEQAAESCHQAREAGFKSRKHRNDWINSIRRYANPIIGKVRIADIEQAHVIAVLKPLWATKTETASRVRQRIEAILAWATVNKYRAGENPARWKGNLEHTFPRPSEVKKTRHFPALCWSEIGDFMIRLCRRSGISAKALEFAILTASRSGEVRLATWDEIDLTRGLWTIPAERMKANKRHLVPLSEPAIHLLHNLPVFEGCPYVFPSPRGKHLSDMALSQLTRRMGINAVPHGFRSTFKDWARSCTSYPDEVSELALAHVSSDATRAAYARDELLPKRTQLMRDWAKFCSIKQTNANVTPISRKA